MQLAGLLPEGRGLRRLHGKVAGIPVAGFLPRFDAFLADCFRWQGCESPFDRFILEQRQTASCRFVPVLRIRGMKLELEA